MSRKWGQDAHAGESERGYDGRFKISILCDCCGKPMGDLDKDGNHFTDSDVCGSSDGPGFFLCHRKRCHAAQEGKTIEERRVMFTTQRDRNDAAKRKERP